MSEPEKPKRPMGFRIVPLEDPKPAQEPERVRRPIGFQPPGTPR